MDKTYAETQGQPPFDWNQFLANPPTLNSAVHGSARIRATDWVTCACGNQCAIIPRTDTHAPLDIALSNLGLNFCGQIDIGNWSGASRTLRAIEARSTVLIAEELAKLNAP